MKWKPKEGERYWFIGDLYVHIYRTKYYPFLNLDKENIKTDNCFKTKKEAQAKLKQILELLKK